MKIYDDELEFEYEIDIEYEIKRAGLSQYLEGSANISLDSLEELLWAFSTLDGKRGQECRKLLIELATM